MEVPGASWHLEEKGLRTSSINPWLLGGGC